MTLETSPDVSPESQASQRIVVTANDTHPPVQGLRQSEFFDAHAFHFNEKSDDPLSQLDKFLKVDIGKKARILSTDGLQRVSPSLLSVSVWPASLEPAGTTISEM